MNSTDGTTTAIDWSVMPDWMTSEEAAEASGYALTHIRHLAREGKIGAQPKGRDWWIDRDKLMQYVDAMNELGNLKHSPNRVRDVTAD